jgi:alkanesulfonate monooxygenase SsuD/methylene tetrahydromethanopterin reductase-like flavin-dependent oxidoreductase (luciferase family)
VHEVGSHFTHDGAATSVRPIQRPHPPIWLGGGSEKALRRAARVADSLYLDPFKTGAMIEALMPVYRRELDACNKPFPAELPIMREIFVSRHPGEAMQKAKPYLEIKYRAYDAWGQGSTHPDNPLNRDFDELAKDRFLIGGRDEVIEQILDLHRRTGVNHLVLGIHWPGMPHDLVTEQMQTLAEEIFPIIRAY